MPPRFSEVQRFRQPWVWALLIGCAGLLWFGAWRQLVDGRPFGGNPAPDWLLALFWLLFGVGLPLWIWRLRLVTVVDDTGLGLRFAAFPLARKHFALADIVRLEVRTYRPIMEYGGWGLRMGAWNVSGDRGVQLHLADGGRFLVGSQRPEALAEALRSVGAGHP